MWVEIRVYVILIVSAIGLCAVSSTGAYFKGRYDGASACDARHDKAQMKENLKERKSDAARDRAKPVNADRDVKLKWLRDNARP